MSSAAHRAAMNLIIIFHVELGGFGDRSEAILLITTVGSFDMLY